MVKTQPGSGSVLDHITQLKGFKETPQAIALRALRSITKSIANHAMIEDIPSDLLFGENIDLHRWSMILKDTAMEQLSKQRETGKMYALDTSATTLPGMFKTFWTKHLSTLGLLHLNIANGKEVTDYGITIVAHNSPELRSLTITGCMNITDAALREVALHCPKLTLLNIQSCHGIKGSGLVSIAECCPFITKLNISKCNSLENWSLQKLFRKTHHLEELIVSYLRDITDEELRVMAEQAHDFMHLEAIECKNITDQAILSISANCKDLDYVDLTRTEFTSRISDITLMALGQKCASLRTLKVNNCDSITDVGIGWLTEGCRVIETLELSGCNKLTDAGLRVLGSNCRALTTLDISQAKSVSDIGIATLSRGCRQLKNVKIPGIFFLADPRLATPGASSKPELWEELIGIPALATYCSNIESLDLTGCFRLNKALAQSLPLLKNLRSLCLKGLNQAVPASLVTVARGCSKLEDINLSDMGKAVNSEVMIALQQYCTDLKVLVACRCSELKGNGIKAISLMEKLEKLDLSGCLYLTDSTLVHLSAIGTLPKLTHLELCNLSKITDSFLAWFAMKDHILLQLSVRSTMISQKALTSVKDRFPNSDMLINANFVGYWPKFRVFDRMMVGKYQRIIDGVTKIQARYRKYTAITRVAFIRGHNRLIAAHFTLHRVARGFIDRCKVRKIRKKRYLEQTSAIVITSIFRMIIPRKKLKKLRYQLYLRMINLKALKIQCAYRSYRARLALRSRRQAKLNRYLFKIRCCVKIQSIGRMFIANCRVLEIREYNKAVERVRQRKSIIIQRYYRGYCGRKVTRFYQDLIDRTKILRDQCSRKIQYRFRLHRTLCIIQVHRQRRMRKIKMSVRIQAVIRGALARLHVAEIQMERVTERRRKAATVIQCRYRVFQARCRFFRKLKERRRLKKLQNDAATVITRCARMKLAWKVFIQKRREYLQRMKADAERLINAATTIQALIRRFLGRVKYLKKLKEHKGKWKELYDEKKKKRFFYNKQTGEIRWRIPQDLLDLVPHPQCDNCTAIEAIIECRVCNELFCGDCFQQVHKGGRRKEHDYRAIYDFYGKRLDYGDGIFPCQWPTEVIQDEIQGWMLRIAPHRQPHKIYKKSGWEEYHFSADEVVKPASIFRKNMDQERVHNSMGAQNPRIFYFNRKSFQSTYDMPQEVAAEQYAESIIANDFVVPRTASSAGYQDPYYASTYYGYSGRAQSSGDPSAMSETYYPNTAPATADTTDYSQLGYYDSEGNWVWYNTNYNNANNFDNTYYPPNSAGYSYSGTPYSAAATPYSAAATPYSDSYAGTPYSGVAYDQNQQQYGYDYNYEQGAVETPQKDSARLGSARSDPIYGTQNSSSTATPRRAARRAGFPSKSPMSTIPHASQSSADDDDDSSQSSSIKPKDSRQPATRRRSVSFEDELTEEFRQRTASYEANSSQSEYDSSIMKTLDAENSSQDGYRASDGQFYHFSQSEEEEEDAEDSLDDYES